MTSFEAGLRIRRPIEEVFAFVSDPLDLPHWNSAVRAVQRTGVPQYDVCATYSMERQLPSGRVQNDMEVFSHDRPVEFGIRTTSGPTPFSYLYRFVPEGRDTLLRLEGGFTPEGAPALLGPLAARAVRHGVDGNLATLKRLLESVARTA